MNELPNNLFNVSMFIKEFQNWFLAEGKKKVEGAMSYEVTMPEELTDNPAMRIDFDHDKVMARITVWEGHTAYLEAIEVDSGKSFMGKNVVDLKSLAELIEVANQFFDDLLSKTRLLGLDGALVKRYSEDFKKQVLPAIIKKLDAIVDEVFHYFAFEYDKKNLTVYDLIRKEVDHDWKTGNIYWNILFPFTKAALKIVSKDDEDDERFESVPESTVLYVKISDNMLLINSTIYSGTLKSLEKVLDLKFAIDMLDEEVIMKSIEEAEVVSKMIATIKEQVELWQKIYG